MIVAAVLFPFVVALEGLMALWPGSGTVGATSSPLFVQYLAGMNSVVDVVGPLYFVSGLLLTVPALLAIRVAVWTYRLTPGKFS